ncbi:hypothetical protein E2C11_07375 [Streptomyces lavendulae]|nr:hypothetical protein [Streptomyces lavendulae]TXJ83289.1 hypothetical protein E2C11_07375 [Streptomyces lavendulae]
MVEIRADEDRLRGILAPAIPPPAAAARTAAAAPETTPTAAAPEAPAVPAPEAGPVLTPQDLTDEQLAAELARLNEERTSASFSSPRHNRLVEQIAPLQKEHEQRAITALQARPDPAGMEDGEIAAEREALAADRKAAQGATAWVDRTAVSAARAERDELLPAEQHRRQAVELENRTPVNQMTTYETRRSSGASAEPRLASAPLRGVRLHMIANPLFISLLQSKSTCNGIS